MQHQHDPGWTVGFLDRDQPRGRCRKRRLVVLVPAEVGQRVEDFVPLGVELVVAGAQPRAERVVGPGVLRLAKEVLLAAFEFGQGTLVPVALGVAVAGLPVVDGSEVGGEQGLAIGAEDPLGVEVADRSE